MANISKITLPDGNTYKFNAYSLTPSHILSGDAGWYKVLTLNVTNGTTRSVDIFISHSYSATAGILRIYLNKISTGQTDASRVNWLTTTIPIEYVRWEIETVSATSTISIYFYKVTNNAGIVDFFLLDYKNRAATTRDLPSGAWLSESVSRPETANIATANILNNAATATNALNDGNGDQIDTTYLKTSQLSSDVNSSSETEAATLYAVKQTYDIAEVARNLALTANSRANSAYSLAETKSKLVRFTAQAVSAASNAEIFRITNSDITTDTEVVSVEFADPSYITAGGSWTSYAGYVAFTGTCTAATTANVILKI